MTGDFKHTIGRTSKEVSVKRIQKLMSKSAATTAADTPTAGAKRKQEEVSDTAAAEAMAKPRSVLGALSQTRIVPMKRVLSFAHEQTMELKQEHDLRPMWESIGMTTNYPQNVQQGEGDGWSGSRGLRRRT